MRLAIILLCAVSALAEPPNPKAIERYKQMLATNPVEGIALDRLWNSATETGSVDALIAEYENAKGFSAKMVLGLLQRKAGRDDDAIFAFEDAAKLEPRSPLPALAIARAELARTRPREAAESFEKAIALLAADDPRLPATLIDLGGAWFSAGDAAKAAAAWERTVALAPGDLDLRRRLADAYAKNSLAEQAIKHLDYVAEHAAPAERADALQRIAALHSGAGRPGNAITALERAVSFTAPDNWLRVELLGQIIRLAQRQHAETNLEEKWRRDADANPRDPAASLRMVEFYERTGNLEQARSWLEKVTAMLPKHAGHRLRLARLLAQLDQLDAAAAAFDALLVVQPGNADVVFERARLDIQREDGVAARARIAALLAQKDDEALRQRAFEFYQEHNLLDLVEEHYKRAAASGDEEAISGLANFYFSQRRNADAMTALARIESAEGPVAERTARLLRVAQLMRAQSEYSAAIEVVKKAQELTPDSRDAFMLLGELGAALTHYTAARSAFGRAYDLSKTEAERIESDTRSFDTFRAEWPALTGSAPGASVRGPVPSYAAYVESHIRLLQAQANERKDVESRLRVARWNAWNGTKAAAMTYASQAIDLDKKNPAPREFMARHLAATGEPARAAVYFRELIDVNPAGRDGYLREIAQLESQAGNHRDALSVFEQLSRAKPGDTDALAELAAAQERAGNLVDAAATWRRVLTLLPAPRKREAGAALLRTLQRLGRHEEASLLLLRSVDETSDERERLARFDELLLHAQQNGQMKWLRERFEERRRLRADDYFTAVALGRTRKLLGDKEGAFEMFADAVFSAPNQAEALPDLVREAEDLRRYPTAIRLQEQMTRVVKQDHPDGLLKLASLYTKAGDLEGAERAWSRAVGHFPRDRAVLRLAADFHRQWGDIARAATLLRKLTMLDTVNARVAAELGEMDFASGRYPEARTAFESVMKLTKPVERRIYPSAPAHGQWSESAPLSQEVSRAEWRRVFSTGSRMRTMMAESSKVEPDAEVRLAAIRRLGEMAARAGGAERERWITEWRPSLETYPTEAMWALYFAGDYSRVLDCVDSQAPKDTRQESRRTFIWLALESAQYSRLGEWLNADARIPMDMVLFQQTFGGWARSRPELVDGEMLDGLFGRGRMCGRLEAAKALAPQPGLYGAAMDVAHRSIEDNFEDRARIAPEVARWLLSAGKVDEARNLLGEAARLPASSLDAAPFTALRYLSAILPEAEWKEFVAVETAKANAATIDGSIRLLALHALAGDMVKASAALDAVLEQHRMSGSARDDTPPMRRWGFLARTWGALFEWGMPELADRIWQHTLADDGLLAAWQQEKVVDKVESDEERSSSPMRSSQLSLSNEQLARDQSDMVNYLLGDAATRGRVVAERSRGKRGGLASLATMLDTHRKGSGAALRFELWKGNLSDPTLLRNAIESAIAAGDTGMQEAIRRLYLDKRAGSDGDDLLRDFATELAGLYERRGDLEAASGILSRALSALRSDVRLKQEHARIFQRMGRGNEAERLLRSVIESDGGDRSARHLLALDLERRGMASEALDVRLRFGGGGDAQVPLLYLKNDRQDDALAALEKLAGNMAVYAAGSLAQALGMRGEARVARSVLVETATRVTDPRGLMQVRKALLTIPGNPQTELFARRMHERMREDARKVPELAADYYGFMERHAARLGLSAEYSQELMAAWAEGKGTIDAGIALVQHHLSAAAKNAAERTCGQILDREDALPRHLTRLDAALDGRGAGAIRLRIAEKAAQRGWPDSEPTFTWIRLLDDAGQREKAREVLARQDWLVLVPGGAELLGQAWLSVGDADRALRFFQLANKSGAPFVSPGVLAGMARAQVARKRLDAAKLLLRRAFSDPSCSDHGAIVAYLEARGELARWREAAREFSTAPDAELRLGLALFAHFEARGNFSAALSLLDEAPRLLFAAPDGVSCLRLRTFARKAGAFAEAKAGLARFAASHVPDADSELAALLADEAEAGGDAGAAVSHLERAATLAPGSWEFARRLAGHYIASKDAVKARQVLAQFLAVSPDAGEREPALALWEAAK